MEQVIKTTLQEFSQMRQTLKTFSRFYQHVVDSVLPPTVRKLSQFTPHKLVEDNKNERQERWSDYSIELSLTKEQKKIVSQKHQIIQE